MAAYCSTGQSPQRAVVLMEEGVHGAVHSRTQHLLFQGTKGHSNFHNSPPPVSILSHILFLQDIWQYLYLYWISQYFRISYLGDAIKLPAITWLSVNLQSTTWPLSKPALLPEWISRHILFQILQSTVKRIPERSLIFRSVCIGKGVVYPDAHILRVLRMGFFTDLLICMLSRYSRVTLYLFNTGFGKDWVGQGKLTWCEVTLHIGLFVTKITSTKWLRHGSEWIPLGVLAFYT
jgi:hypothetical protein